MDKLTLAEVEAMEARFNSAPPGTYGTAVFTDANVSTEAAYFRGAIDRLLRSWRAQRETLLRIKEWLRTPVVGPATPETDATIAVIQGIAAEVADVD